MRSSFLQYAHHDTSVCIKNTETWGLVNLWVRPCDGDECSNENLCCERVFMNMTKYPRHINIKNRLEQYIQHELKNLFKGYTYKKKDLKEKIQGINNS